MMFEQITFDQPSAAFSRQYMAALKAPPQYILSSDYREKRSKARLDGLKTRHSSVFEYINTHKAVKKFLNKRYKGNHRIAWDLHEELCNLCSNVMDFSWASNEYLAKKIGRTPKTVQRALTVLEECGIVSRLNITNGARGARLIRLSKYPGEKLPKAGKVSVRDLCTKAAEVTPYWGYISVLMAAGLETSPMIWGTSGLETAIANSMEVRSPAALAAMMTQMENALPGVTVTMNARKAPASRRLQVQLRATRHDSGVTTVIKEYEESRFRLNDLLLFAGLACMRVNLHDNTIEFFGDRVPGTTPLKNAIFDDKFDTASTNLPRKTAVNEEGVPCLKNVAETPFKCIDVVPPSIHASPAPPRRGKEGSKPSSIFPQPGRVEYSDPEAVINDLWGINDSTDQETHTELPVEKLFEDHSADIPGSKDSFAAIASKDVRTSASKKVGEKGIYNIPGSDHCETTYASLDVGIPDTPVPVFPEEALTHLQPYKTCVDGCEYPVLNPKGDQDGSGVHAPLSDGLNVDPVTGIPGTEGTGPKTIYHPGFRPKASQVRSALSDGEEAVLDLKELVGLNSRFNKHVLLDPVALRFANLFKDLTWTRKRVSEWIRLSRFNVYDERMLSILEYCAPLLKCKEIPDSKPLYYPLLYLRKVDSERLLEWYVLHGQPDPESLTGHTIDTVQVSLMREVEDKIKLAKQTLCRKRKSSTSRSSPETQTIS